MENEEIIEITRDKLDIPKNEKIDIEKFFNFFNLFFIIISTILILVFIIQLKYGLLNLNSIDLSNFTYKYSNYREGGNIFGVFTYMFLHGGFEHIFSNLLFFYYFSLIIDKIFSLKMSIILFLILGILSGIPGYFLNNIPSIGASGAIFGLFGISTVFYGIYYDKLENNLKDSFCFFIFLAIIQFIYGFLDPMIDVYAHLFGYLFGLIIGYFYIKKIDILEFKKSN